eukprot:scaffold1377_cov126-Cylindrotheca_fusiformis.AAC.17
MQFKDGTCDWDDVKDQFVIGRHGLQHKIPVKKNGDIDCKSLDGERRFPRLDYSKGFSDWWFLSQTEISVPSEHVQHGKRYDAEVVLSHFYEFKHPWNRVGKVAIFMDAYEGERAWHFLDKLICQWRKVEEENRSKCNLPPAPVYKMCELYRGQTRSSSDLESPTEQVTYPTYTPLTPPKAIPIVNYGGEPPLDKKPLQLCEGDCDFFTDCAKGLICHRRDAFEGVPGCIGGEEDFTNTDYCVFDVYGEGYDRPTDSPTQNPTITNRPSITPIPPRPLVFFGSTPPADKYPLQYCEGDCDIDEDCGEGLTCFQRDEYMPVPGCIGTDENKTDYCILDPYGDGYTFVPTGSLAPSIAPFARPTGPMKSIENLGWEPNPPIGECQGDCDQDSDCEVHMYCFQRNAQFEAVPGCLGGEEDSTLTDYCTYKEQAPTPPPVRVPTPEITLSPTVAPVPTLQPTTANPTQAPSMGPYKEVEIKFMGWTPAQILNQCEGDCDKDLDCSPGLLCFDRNGQYEPVPSCIGAELDDSLSDYCFDPRAYDTAAPTDGNPPPTAAPSNGTPSPTESPSKAPVSPTSAPSSAAPITPGPTYDPIHRLCQTNSQCLQQGLTGYCCPMLNGEFNSCCDDGVSDSDGVPEVSFIGWTPSPESMPLKLCEGDCDIDQDCGPGLECYQRYDQYEEVPGCSGGDVDDSLADYCHPAGATFKPTLTTTTHPSRQPTTTPTSAKAFETGYPPEIDCRSDEFGDVNFNRMCNPDSCCSIPRKAGGFCERMYTILGDLVESACHHCCIEADSAGFPREVGPAAVENPDIPKTIECNKVNEVYKTCRDNSCCDGEDDSFCRSQLDLYPDDMESICVSFNGNADFHDYVDDF